MRQWKIAIVKDTSKPMLGLHGLHVAFRGLPNTQVIAHVDSNTQNLPEKLSTTQARKHYLTPQAMFHHESPDILVICSRHPDDHLPLIQLAAENHCHVYCEKPLANTLDEADAIIAIAQSARIKIAMAHPARHGPSFRMMKTLIDQGHIGTPLVALGRGKCDHRGGGEDLVVLGTHILDLMTHYFGHPQNVYAQITQQNKPITPSDRTHTVEPIGPCAGDRIFATFNFPQGVRGQFESQKDLYTNRVFMGLTVHGTKGALALRFGDGTNEDLKICRVSCAPEDDAPYETVPIADERTIPHAAPLDHTLPGQRDIPTATMFLHANRFAAWDLMQAIEHDRQPLASVCDARTVLEVIQGIYTSHFARRPVDFPLTTTRHPLDVC